LNSTLHQRVLQTIRQYGMIHAGQRVSVALSGGADSVALLLLLQEMSAELGCVLSAAHLNHQLRGADAGADEEFVRELASKAGVELIARRVDVAAEAARNKWNLEDAGRRVRLQFFHELEENGRADRIAVAHTADDQAETVLAHFLRGSGISGLAGIRPVAGCVIRPLLDVRRAELRAYLTDRGQPWREDATNRDTARLRARLRHELIPRLEAAYQPALTERLCQFAEIAAGEEAFWRELLDEMLPRMIERDATGLLIPVSSFAAASKEAAGDRSLAVARRMVRRLAQEVSRSGGGVAAEHVERVLELARGGHSGQTVELPAGIIVQRTPDARLRFTLRGGETNGPAPSYQYTVEWPLQQGSAVEVAEVGSRFRLKLIDWPAASSDTRQGPASLDAGLLAPPLLLRNWRPGDAYRPVGYRRAHKLKELLYRARVEAARRSGWPVLESAGRIVWTRGLPPAVECAASAETQLGLVIAEERI
jgi:tRNA(Ile)-lysidine synthase